MSALVLLAFWIGAGLLALAPFILTSRRVRAQRDFYAAKRARECGEILQFPNSVSEKSARPKSRAPSWASTMVRPKIGRIRKIG